MVGVGVQACAGAIVWPVDAGYPESVKSHRIHLQAYLRVISLNEQTS